MGSGCVLDFMSIAKPLLIAGNCLAFLLGLGIAAFGMYVGTTLQNIQEVSWGAYGVVTVGALIVFVAGYGIRSPCLAPLPHGDGS